VSPIPKRLGSRLLFGLDFLRYPRLLGSAVPSTQALARRIIAHCPWPRTQLVVEFGPGVGVITAPLLRRLGPDGALVAVEINPRFVAHLRRTIRDARLAVLHGAAQDAAALLAGRGLGPPDVVIMGIPLSMLGRDERLELLRRTWALLKPGGRLLLYQFSRRALPDLRAVFGDVRWQLELVNLPPAWVFIASKHEAAKHER
jgi:phospholipid N-methyltransferase